MTVEELRKQLKAYDKDTLVYLCNPSLTGKYHRWGGIREVKEMGPFPKGPNQFSVVALITSGVI